jgi:pyruvate dehydrogenase E2 component (dihydrolipoamide acetyltransferase)
LPPSPAAEALAAAPAPPAPAAPLLPAAAPAAPAAPLLPAAAPAAPGASAAALARPLETTETPKGCPKGKSVGKHVSIPGEQAKSIRAGTVISFVPWKEADYRTNERLKNYEYGQCHIRVRWADTNTDQILDPSNVDAITDDEFNAYVSRLPKKAPAPEPVPLAADAAPALLPPSPAAEALAAAPAPPAPAAPLLPAGAALEKQRIAVANAASAKDAPAQAAYRKAGDAWKALADNKISANDAALHAAAEAAQARAEAEAMKSIVDDDYGGRNARMADYKELDKIAKVKEAAAAKAKKPGGGKRRRHKTPKRRRVVGRGNLLSEDVASINK